MNNVMKCEINEKLNIRLFTLLLNLYIFYIYNNMTLILMDLINFDIIEVLCF
jgi:hypothetical protein